jgi:hypothetical protein
MMTKGEIEAKSEAFGIHISNVERDYVFGWLLCAIYSASPLGRILVLKKIEGRSGRGAARRASLFRLGV